MPSSDEYSGYATNFGGLYDQIKYAQALAQGKSARQALAKGDPGFGAPRLGTVNSSNSYGVAVPTEYLRANIGNDPADWRTARAQLTVGDQTVTAPFIDIGPSKGQQKKGVVVDVSTPLSDALGGFDKTKASVKIIPNAGPDYVTDQDEWHKEQASIGKQFPAPANQSKTPWTSLLTKSGWMSLMAGPDEDKKLPADALTAIV